MIKSLRDIENVSAIDQNLDHNIHLIRTLDFEDTSIREGGFGKVYSVASIDGQAQDKKYVVKLFDKPELQDHAYNTIKFLHEKVKKHQISSRIPVFHEYPQLLGMPFLAFNAFNQIDEVPIVGLLMFDLSELEYEDFGADTNSNLLSDSSIAERFVYAFQLAKALDFLHKNKFIHSDISNNAIWVNRSARKLALIDYDSGFHYDLQANPNTMGKITHWIGGLFRTKIARKETENITTNDRIAEENWILANAIFEIITSVMPYFFLVDSEDKTKKQYLKENVWPAISENSESYNPRNKQQHRDIINLLESLENAGLEELSNAFSKVYNKGYSKIKERLSVNEWKELLYSICAELEELKPVIDSFQCSNITIKMKSESIAFNWEVSNADSVYIAENLVSLFETNYSLKLDDSRTIVLTARNDFGQTSKEINIKALKKDPVINSFKVSDPLRKDLNPLILSWETRDTKEIRISGVNDVLNSNSHIEIEPTSFTEYRLIAIGFFDQIVEETIAVDVVLPSIQAFKYEINLEHGIDNVDILWDTNHAQKVLIEPRVGSVQKKGTTHINIGGETEFQLIATGYFGKTEKTIIAHPFPVPIIETIFSQAPNLELSSEYNMATLKLPSEVLDIPSIVYKNSIDFAPTSLDTLFQKLEINLNEYELPTFETEIIESERGQSIIYSALKRIKSMIHKAIKRN